MIELDKKITVYDGDGNEHELEVLFTYDHEERKTSYVFFFDPETPDDILCMKYDEEGNLFEVEDEDEFQEMEEVLEAYLEDPQIQELKKEDK